MTTHPDTPTVEDLTPAKIASCICAHLTEGEQSLVFDVFMYEQAEVLEWIGRIGQKYWRSEAEVAQWALRVAHAVRGRGQA
jgi:hypothetical protein